MIADVTRLLSTDRQVESRPLLSTMDAIVTEFDLTGSGRLTRMLNDFYADTDLAELVEYGTELHAHTIAEATKATYGGHLERFQRFCEQHGADARTNPTAVVGYLVFLAATGRTADGEPFAVSTLHNILYAIARWHRAEGLEDPTRSPEVRDLMDGFARKFGRMPTQAMALSLEQLGRVAMHLRMPERDRRADLFAALAITDPDSQATYSALAAASWDHVALPTTPGEPALLVVNSDPLSIPARPDDLTVCPVTLLQGLALDCDEGPILPRRDGDHMSRQALTKRVATLANEAGIALDHTYDPRTHNRRPVLPATDRRRLAEHVDQPGLSQIRDLAIILTACWGQYRPSGIAGLDVGDVRFDDGGMRTIERRSKNDQYGHGTPHDIAYQQARPLCAARAVRSWLTLLPELLGRDPDKRDPLFVGFGKDHGHRLSAKAISAIFQRRCEAASIEAPHGFRISGQTGRATGATRMLQKRHSPEVVAKAAGRASTDSQYRYARVQGDWDSHPTSGATEQ